MRITCCIALLIISLPAFAGEPVAKSPVPEAAKVAEAEKTIKDIFKDEYAKRGVEDRKALAQKLLQQGNETKDDAASQYVLLKEAAALAVQGGDAETVLKALDGLGAGFEVDALALKADALGKIAPASADAAKALTRTYLKVIDEAVAADSYDVAVRLSSAADTVARKTQDMPLVTQLVARGKEVRALQADFAKVKAAQATLKEKPDDPEANLAVGKFLCFTKGDWDKGLPLLAQGSDAKLKEVAEKDLAAHSDASACTALADSYWELAETPRSNKDAIQRRAAKWYKVAAPNLKGLDKTRVDKRLATVEAKEINQNLRNREFTDLYVKLSTSAGAGGHVVPKLVTDPRMITFNSDRPIKFFKRGALGMMEEFVGKTEIFMTHPFSVDKPGLADFSAITSVATGTLVLHLHPFLDCNCVVKLMVDDKEFKKLDIGKSRWSTVEIPFKNNKVVLENHANDWYNEGVFITYEIK